MIAKDVRADRIFRKRYYLKGKQVNLMRQTFNYQALVLKLRLKDLWAAITGKKI